MLYFLFQLIENQCIIFCFLMKKLVFFLSVFLLKKSEIYWGGVFFEKKNQNFTKNSK